MKHRGAEIIVRLLERQGIEYIAGIPGGSNLPLYDALYDSSIQHVLARHEQGAGFMAQGMARVTGRAAVCLATSGPGAMNLLTAIADAKLDSIPMVAITGQVPTAMLGTDAFQEVDTYGLTLPITKHNFLVRRTCDLLEVIPKAFRLAESGRPGPVVVDVPKDMQQMIAEFDAWPEPWSPLPRRPIEIPPNLLTGLACMISQSRKPMLCIGGGIIASNSGDLARDLSHRITAPVATTLMGLGAVPCDDPLYLGMLGMHGSRCTNMLLDEADLVVALGMRFGDRATGKAAEFCRNARIVHVDIDNAEIDKIIRTDLSITADAADMLSALLPMLEKQERPEWARRVREMKQAAGYACKGEASFDSRSCASSSIEDCGANCSHPHRIIRAVGEALGPDDIIATDVGQHQMWTAQTYPFRRPRTLLTSSGLGTMGFGLPAAIGAALARPERQVVSISGDGSILMNIQELATLAEWNLNVKVLVMNNGQLGLVRQQQEMFFKSRFVASSFSALPDFAAIARGFGVRSYDLADAEDPLDALQAMLSIPGPALINVPLSGDKNVLPMVPPGAANREMIGDYCHA